MGQPHTYGAEPHLGISPLTDHTLTCGSALYLWGRATLRGHPPLWGSPTLMGQTHAYGAAPTYGAAPHLGV